MARSATRWQPALPPVVTDLDAELDCIAKLGVEDLRALWRERWAQEPPEAVSKDLIARALAHWLQEPKALFPLPHRDVARNGQLA